MFPIPISYRHSLTNMLDFERLRYSEKNEPKFTVKHLSITLLIFPIPSEMPLHISFLTMRTKFFAITFQKEIQWPFNKNSSLQFSRILNSLPLSFEKSRVILRILWQSFFSRCLSFWPLVVGKHVLIAQTTSLRNGAHFSFPNIIGINWKIGLEEDQVLIEF